MKCVAYRNSSRKLLLSVLVFAIVLGFCLPAFCAVRTEAEKKKVEKYKNIVMRDVMVPMRDGVRLATDIYLPADPNTGQVIEPGKFPAILVRTPYIKTKIPNEDFYQHFARMGYAAIAQDCRGRGNSEGEFYIYINDGQDGYDAIEWIAAQPWCNGDVGTCGGSYMGSVQSAHAAYTPPHLKTMIILGGPSDYIKEGAAKGGAFYVMKNLIFPFWLSESGKEAEDDPNVAKVMKKARKNLGPWSLAAPLKPSSPLHRVPSYMKWYDDWRNHPPYDREYWDQLGFYYENTYDKYPDIPICYISGWYDFFSRGTLRNFDGVSKRNKVTKLIMCSGLHGTPEETVCGDVDFGKGSSLDIDEFRERWFAQFLLCEDKGILEEPTVKYFLIDPNHGTSKNKDGHLLSGGKWMTADTWPPRGFAERKFYLHGDGSISESVNTSSKKLSRFQYDPKKPVPTLGGNFGAWENLLMPGALNQTFPEVNAASPKLHRIARQYAENYADNLDLPLSARQDVLVFRTEPLEEDVEVTGWLYVKLWVSSEAKDTDFTAKLVDVFPPSGDYPEGYAMNVLDGILRMRCREGVDGELMEPGKTYPVSIELWATAYNFRKGHRIRLDISSSNFPLHEPNPNTGEPLGAHTHTIATLNTLYHDAEHPSHLLLPVRQK